MLEFHIHAKPMSLRGGFDVYIVADTGKGQHDAQSIAPGQDVVMLPAMVTQIKLETMPNHNVDVPVAMQLSKEEAQQLMDALFNAGVRPTNGAGSVGQLAATQAHLVDMQDVAKGLLKVQETFVHSCLRIMQEKGHLPIVETTKP